ncbi:PD-(D/E)XK motif protein [Bacillus pacificus]|uniref:PD-(D/E)XK motif protein n=1 Tax=Bacillus TaxID=1386 RepID=UPI000347AD44|nr:PD-(D/E)XK motif protein [Bacillus pacificus]MCC2419568.1 PD-(D/E)XK motif protein [Bacillus pacificus]MCU5008817.1 PD-(D/E)XK motif protein [Bacillus pacificus]MCU5259513.1 PD-(D/E)XK motif protein [Bacillus pacificus]MCU5562035.1 PD-(D/E)XK motif protein [Bacillus pacificus]HDR3524596.1 PD-(D/E)XK motif protein [Bacillus pacificus]
MINISEKFKLLIDRSKNEESDDIYRLEPVYFQKPFILIGVDLLNLQRRIYVDITNETWDEDQLKSFPKWRGIDIGQEYFERIGPLKDKNFLVISQIVEDGEEIFERVLQNLVDHILVEVDSPLYTVVYEVLDRWHNFFKRKWNSRLNPEEEMGLFGELYYINKWLEKFPDEPPLIIKDWKGPLKNRIDFVSKNSGVEIKTVVPKIRNEIKISNEKQLELNPVTDKLFLFVLKVEVNDAVGRSLQSIIEVIDEQLIERAPSLAVKFKDLLLEVGVMGEEYDENCFFVHEELAYLVNVDFPKLTSENLPIGINNVSYSIDLSHCNNFKVSAEDIFNLK